jgi:hypothetical protein
VHSVLDPRREPRATLTARIDVIVGQPISVPARELGWKALADFVGG